MTNLPGLPALVAASAAFVISASLRPASSARVSNVTADAPRSFSTFCANVVCSVASSALSARSLALLGLGQLRAGAHEVLVVAPQQARGFGVEAQRVALLVQRVDAREQARVELHLVAMRGELGRHLALRRPAASGRCWSWSGWRRSSRRDRSVRPERSIATMVLSKVGLSGFDAIASISLRCSAHALLERRQEVVVADLVEAREVQRQRALDEQRVGRRRVGGLGGAHERGQRGSHEQVAQGLDRGVAWTAWCGRGGAG